MPCRHTVPDWHRHAEGNPAAPIFAGCRLLIKEGERAADPRAIACAFWGHQGDCPQYEGPGKRSGTLPAAPRAAHDEPIPAEPVWPVRPPGTPDRIRTGLMALGITAIVLMLYSLIDLETGWTGSAGRILLSLALAFSVVGHALGLIRLWARG